MGSLQPPHLDGAIQKYGALLGGFFHWAAHRTALWPWIAPPLGLALVAWLTQYVFPGTQGSGIPQTIAALSISDPP